MATVERESITIELCGLSFEWVAPVRRVSRKMLRDLFEVIKKNPALQVKDAKDMNPIDALTAMDEVLDYFYRWHPGMKEKEGVLDDADEKSIGEAFQKLMEFMMRPFVSEKGAPTNTQKPEPTS